MEIPIDLSLKMSRSCHTLSKALHMSKKLHEIQKLGMRQRLYKYYRKWTVDLRKNHGFENQIDELICTFQDIQYR